MQNLLFKTAFCVHNKRPININSADKKMLVAYIKITPDSNDLAYQHNQIIACLKDRNLILDTIQTYSDISEISKDILHAGDTLIIADMLVLGDSLSQIHDNIKNFLQHGITILSVSENCEITPDTKGHFISEGMELLLKIRKSLISNTTSKALARKKAAGVRLGREKTP